MRAAASTKASGRPEAVLTSCPSVKTGHSETEVEVIIESEDWTGRPEAYEKHIKLWKRELWKGCGKTASIPSKDESSSSTFSVFDPGSHSSQYQQNGASHSSAIISPRDDWLDAVDNQEVKAIASPIRRAPRAAASQDSRAASAELELSAPPSRLSPPDRIALSRTDARSQQAARSVITNGSAKSLASPRVGPAAHAERTPTIPATPASQRNSFGSLFSGSSGSTETVAQGTASSSKVPQNDLRNIDAPQSKRIDLQERDWNRRSPSSPQSPQLQTHAQPIQRKDKGKRKAIPQDEVSSDGSDHDGRRPRETDGKQLRLGHTIADRRVEVKGKEKAIDTTASKVKQQERAAHKARRKDERGRRDKAKRQKIGTSQSKNFSSTSGKVKKRREGDIDDLSSSINADAFARSTAPSTRKDFAAKLEKLRQARKGTVKGLFSDDSDSQAGEGESHQSISSDDDSGSDSSSGSSSFLVDDDESEPEIGQVSRPALAPVARKRSPPTLVSVLPHRMGLAEAAILYVEWLVYKILSTTHSVPRSRQEEHSKARKFLQQHAGDSQRLLSSSAMRRQFSWYLKQYPTLERRMLFTSEMQVYRGCAACHRSKQKCDSVLTFGGRLYSRGTLEWLDEEEDAELSSDMSSNAEDLVEHRSAKNPSQTFDRRGNKKGRVHLFFAGSFCASRAVLLHALTHWEIHTLDRVYKSAECKEVAAKHAAGKEVKDREVELVVKRHVEKLKRELLSLRNQATDIARK